MIQRRDLLGHEDGIAFGHECDARTEFEGLGHPGRDGECDVWIVTMPVLARQLAAARPGRRPTCRNVGVLRKEKRFEPACFGSLRQNPRRDRVVRRKHEYAKVRHGQSFELSRSR